MLRTQTVTLVQRIVAAAAVAALAFAGVTWWALEGDEVAVLRTRGADGAFHETRVWVADDGGFAWLEAATPEREWYARVQRDPGVELVRGGETAVYVATPLPGTAGRALVRRLLRNKYGLKDAWVGLLQDTSRSIAVRLTAAGAARGRASGAPPAPGRAAGAPAPPPDDAGRPGAQACEPGAAACGGTRPSSSGGAAW